jgi:circadian clock protein KaiB
MSPNRKDTPQGKKDPQVQIEQAEKDRQSQKYIFRLYVSGMTPRSTRAIENIRKLSDEYLKDRYELEVVDIYKHPEAARDVQVIAAPTLIKELPLPLRRFIGDLSDSEKILVGLEIKD